MGSYQSIDIGPYLLVSKIQVDSTEDKNVCINDGKESKDKFCSDCGGEIVKKTFPCKIEKGASDIMNSGEFIDQLVRCHDNDKFDVLVPNINVPMGLNRISDNGSTVREITSDRMVKEIEWFKKEYTNIISAIIDYMGEEHVMIEWGVVIHYN